MRGGRHGARYCDRAHLGFCEIVEPPGLKREIALRIGVIARQMRKAFDQRVGETGTTHSQWTLLAVVSRRPGATQRTIAETLDMSEASAGRLIDKLCRDGLLERRAKDDDRRAHCLYITKNATPLLVQMGELGVQTENEAFAGLSGNELEQLKMLLDRIYTNFGSGRYPDLK